MLARQKLNFAVDALLLLVLCAITGTGLLVRYVLLPGREAWERYGSNRLFVWGMERHEWGAVHFVLGIAFAVLLVLHVALHWRMVVGIYRGLVRNRAARAALLWLFVCACVLLMLFPFAVGPQVRVGGRGRGGPARMGAAR